MDTPAPLDRRGLLASICAYVLWGLFPLYWVLLKTVPSLQIIAHRVVWCALFVVGYLGFSQGFGWLQRSLAKPHVGTLLALSSMLISANWGIYIWAVTHAKVVDASLGYFINPLVSVLLGVLVLRERLNNWQWSAVTIAAMGVLWLAFKHGQPPWIALSLAMTFGTYGLIRKMVVVEAVAGLAIESLFLLLPALAWLAWAQFDGVGALGRQGRAIDLLLVFGGALTALPLICFAYGARRIPYSLVGILQFISPSLQLFCGVLVLGEGFSRDQAIGFGCIWLALTVYALDGWRRTR